MGIRFLCDACGKKLNIKEDLAGKRGRCPKCNAKISIPRESTLERVNTKATPPGESSEQSRLASHRQELAEIQQENQSSVTPVPPTGKQPGEVDAGPETPMVDRPDYHVQIPDPAAQEVFQESPDAKWFVRPSSGGQFGPAEPDVMSEWLKEGRVGRDSFVWREGWEEWQSAGEVFAEELGGPPPAPEEKVVDEPKVSSYPKQPGNRIVNHQLARRRAKTMQILLVIGLAIVSIALTVFLVYVVSNRQGKTNQEKKESANLSFQLRENHNRDWESLVIS